MGKIPMEIKQDPYFWRIYKYGKISAGILFKCAYEDFIQICVLMYLDKNEKPIARQWQDYCFEYGFYRGNPTNDKWTAYPHLPNLQNFPNHENLAKSGEKVCSIPGCKNKVVYSRMGGICRNHNKSIKRKEKRNERPNTTTH